MILCHFKTREPKEEMYSNVIVITALNLVFHGFLNINMLNLSMITNINFGGQKDRCAKKGIRKTNRKLWHECVCLHIYVLTVLTLSFLTKQFIFR